MSKKNWPKPITDIYMRALSALSGDDRPLRYGPAHVVWDGENFDLAERCLRLFDEWVRWFGKGGWHREWFGGEREYTKEQLAIVRCSLRELARLPMDVRRRYAQSGGVRGKAGE